MKAICSSEQGTAVLKELAMASIALCQLKRVQNPGARRGGASSMTDPSNSPREAVGASGCLLFLSTSTKRRAVFEKVTPSQQQHLVSCGWSFQIWANSLDIKEMALVFQTSVIEASHAGTIAFSALDNSEVSLWSSLLAIHCGKSG